MAKKSNKVKEEAGELFIKEEFPPEITPDELQILYALSKEATIKVSNAIMVANILKKVQILCNINDDE